MNCLQAQEAILEMFDGTSADVRAHAAECPACAAFLARQSELDQNLSGLFRPAPLSADFRAGLRERIRREPVRMLPQWLPDAVHLGSCAAATAACALLLPVGAGPVLAAGAAVTLASYVLVLMTRIAIEN
jgi:anti-sigma factor RsiW